MSCGTCTQNAISSAIKRGATSVHLLINPTSVESLQDMENAIKLIKDNLFNQYGKSADNVNKILDDTFHGTIMSSIDNITVKILFEPSANIGVSLSVKRADYIDIGEYGAYVQVRPASWFIDRESGIIHGDFKKKIVKFSRPVTVDEAFKAIDKELELSDGNGRIVMVDENNRQIIMKYNRGMTKDELSQMLKKDRNVKIVGIAGQGREKIYHPKLYKDGQPSRLLTEHDQPFYIAPQNYSFRSDDTNSVEKLVSAYHLSEDFDNNKEMAFSASMQSIHDSKKQKNFFFSGNMNYSEWKNILVKNISQLTSE